jgi:hypothetical protein
MGRIREYAGYEDRGVGRLQYLGSCAHSTIPTSFRPRGSSVAPRRSMLCGDPLWIGPEQWGTRSERRSLALAPFPRFPHDAHIGQSVEPSRSSCCVDHEDNSADPALSRSFTTDCSAFSTQDHGRSTLLAAGSGLPRTGRARRSSVWPAGRPQRFTPAGQVTSVT